MPLPFPGSEPAGAQPASCVPCARLFADHVVVTSTDGLSCALREALVPLVELSFDYGGTRVRASDPRTRVFRSDTGVLEAVERDVPAETAARHVLERLGAIELACADTVAPPSECEADYVVRADGDEHTFCAFAARALARWRALGWRVEIADDFPFRVVESEPAWYARIEPCEERPDWFGLELGVEIDGKRVDLLPLLLELLEGLEADGRLESLARSSRAAWALRINETHSLSVPVDRLRALLRVVAELYQGEHRGGRSFPEVRAGALLELDAVFRATGGSIAWNDPTRITERARGLTAPLPPVEAPAELRATLRPYQQEGVAFLQRLRESGSGGVLADEMGLGKTLQTIAHICIEKAAGRLDAPALVVGPTTLVVNWARETARFAPHLRVVVLHGPERKRHWAAVEGADVVVTTYPVLVRDEERFAGTRFHLVVLDEAQAIKNARSQARRSLERIAAEHRLCLTGTPVENHLGELWSLFDWLAPGLLGDELSFRRFWRKPIEERGDPERLAALRHIVTPLVLRRLKRDVARELPPKTELGVPVELGGPQRELYECIRLAAHADVRKAIRAKGLAASSVTILDALTKLRQVVLRPAPGRHGLGARRSRIGEAHEPHAAPRGPARGRPPGPRLLAIHEHARAGRRGAGRPGGSVPASHRGDARAPARRRRLRGGPCGRFPHQPQGRRNRVEPDERRYRGALRPVVEPGVAGAGNGSRVPHRADEARVRAQPLRRRHGGRARARAAAKKARSRLRGPRRSREHGRESAHGTRRRRAARAHGMRSEAERAVE